MKLLFEVNLDKVNTLGDLYDVFGKMRASVNTVGVFDNSLSLKVLAQAHPELDENIVMQCVDEKDNVVTMRVVFSKAEMSSNQLDDSEALTLGKCGEDITLKTADLNS